VVISQVSAGRANRLWFSFDGPTSSYSFDQEQPETGWRGSLDENRIIRRDPSKQLVAQRPYATPSGHPQGYQQAFNDFVDDAYAELRGETRDGLPRFADGLRAAHLTEAVIAFSLDQRWVDVPTTGSLLVH
jgi:predicted dehydrogenase